MELKVINAKIRKFIDSDKNFLGKKRNKDPQNSLLNRNDFNMNQLNSFSQFSHKSPLPQFSKLISCDKVPDLNSLNQFPYLNSHVKVSDINSHAWVSQIKSNSEVYELIYGCQFSRKDDSFDNYNDKYTS